MTTQTTRRTPAFTGRRCIARFHCRVFACRRSNTTDGGAFIHVICAFANDINITLLLLRGRPPLPIKTTTSYFRWEKPVFNESDSQTCACTHGRWRPYYTYYRVNIYYYYYYYRRKRGKKTRAAPCVCVCVYYYTILSTTTTTTTTTTTIHKEPARARP